MRTCRAGAGEEGPSRPRPRQVVAAPETEGRGVEEGSREGDGASRTVTGESSHRDAWKSMLPPRLLPIPLIGSAVDRIRLCTTVSHHSNGSVATKTAEPSRKSEFVPSPCRLPRETLTSRSSHSSHSLPGPPRVRPGRNSTAAGQKLAARPRTPALGPGAPADSPRARSTRPAAARNGARFGAPAWSCSDPSPRGRQGAGEDDRRKRSSPAAAPFDRCFALATEGGDGSTAGAVSDDWPVEAGRPRSSPRWRSTEKAAGRGRRGPGRSRIEGVTRRPPAGISARSGAWSTARRSAFGG